MKIQLGLLCMFGFPPKLMWVILTHDIGIGMHCWIASFNEYGSEDIGIGGKVRTYCWIASLTSIGLNDPRHSNRLASDDIQWRLTWPTWPSSRLSVLFGCVFIQAMVCRSMTWSRYARSWLSLGKVTLIQIFQFTTKCTKCKTNM